MEKCAYQESVADIGGKSYLIIPKILDRGFLDFSLPYPVMHKRLVVAFKVSSYYPDPPIAAFSIILICLVFF